MSRARAGVVPSPSACEARAPPPDVRPRCSLLLQPDLFERRGPGIRVDQQERGLGHAGPDPARPDVLVDRRDADPLVHELLDLVEEHLALLLVRLDALLLVEGVDVGIAAVGPGAVA